MGTTQRHYDNAICYLEKNYDYSFFSEDFDENHSASMITFLKENAEDFSLQHSLHSLVEAIQDFFSSYHQDVSVLYYKDRFIVKYLNPIKNISHALDKQSLHKLRVYLFELAENLHEYYQSEDLVIFHEEHFDTILSFFKDVPAQSAKEIIKCKISKIFNLCECDKVFFIHNKLAIRFNSKQNKTLPKERRYNGIPVKELEKLEDEFINDTFEKKLQRELKRKFRTTLNFSHVNNKKFCSIYIKEFQEIIALTFKKEKNKIDKEFFNGFVNYILRKNFDTLLYLCASQVLELVKKSAPNIDQFIRFYNGETLFKNAEEKHQRPLIIDKDNQKWSFGTIRTFYMGLDNQEQKLKEIETLHNEIIAQTNMMGNLSNTIEINKKELNELSLILKSDMEDMICSQENLYKKEDKLIEQKNFLQKELRSLEINIDNKEKKINNWQVVLKEIQSKLVDQRETYENMSRMKEELIIAFAKVINKKSIVIKEKRELIA